MVRTLIVWALLVGTALTSQASAQDEPDGAELKGFMAGSQAVDAFIKALRNHDLDGLMKTVDVPFFKDGKEIVRTDEELRNFFQPPLEEKGFSELKADIMEVQQFKDVRDKATGDAGELLKKVAQDDDLMFRLTVNWGSKTEGMMLLVRVKEGGPKIIGLRD